MALWLGLFAMLMIHVGPLISGTQALVVNRDAVTSEHHVHELAISAPARLALERSIDSTDHQQHAVMLAAANADAATQIEQTINYHALMGHQPAPAGAPQWLTNLEMCGYCDLLTVSPPLVLALLLALPVVPSVQWLAVLPAPPRPLPAVHSLRHPRAPPVHLFT